MEEKAKKIIDDLELEVASPTKKYIENLYSGMNMHQEVYGEKFEKYLDVI